VHGSKTALISAGPSEWLAEEIREALQKGVPLLLVNEMPAGLSERSSGRRGVDFGTFFACKEGATPSDLLQAGMYAKISTPLKGRAVP